MAEEENLRQMRNIIAHIKQLKESDGIAYYYRLAEELVKFSTLLDAIEHDYKTKVDEVLRACNTYLMDNSINRIQREELTSALLIYTKFFSKISDLQEYITESHSLIQEFICLINELECLRKQKQK